MRTNNIRSVALILSVCLSSFAQAQYGGYSAAAYDNYSAPPNAMPLHPSAQPRPQAGYHHYAAPPPNQNYRPAPPYRTVGQNGGGYETLVPPAPNQTESMPSPEVNAPKQMHGHESYPAYPSYPATESPSARPIAEQSIGSGATYGYSEPNMYVQAAGAPSCGGSCEPMNGCGVTSCYPEPTLISPWFGSMNMLFLTRENNYDRALVHDDAMPSTTWLRAADADLDFALGYDTTVGKYIGCGQYAVSATWLYIDNGSSDASVMPAMPGGYRANHRNWDRVYFDRTGDGMHTDYGMPATDESIYAYFDRAESYRVRREAQYYGLELNLTGFGIGGAARAGRPVCGPPGQTGCGGLCGPLIPSCSPRMQFQWTTGFRWFHFEESFAYSARSERFPAAPAIVDTFTYSVDTENELYGFQLGGQLAYCLGSRTSVYAGVKAGLYANDASLRSRLGSDSMPARVSNLPHAYPSYSNQIIATDVSDTVLASLAEIDLGIGYRIFDCWTVRGGYRVLAAGGVATAIDNINDDPAHRGSSNVWANDNLILHGGYVGLNYNW